MLDTLDIIDKTYVWMLNTPEKIDITLNMLQNNSFEPESNQRPKDTCQ